MKKVKAESITKIAKLILEKNGVPSDQADIIADTILYAHQRGRHTHGLNRLQIYIRKINEGLMKADTDPKVISDSKAVTVFDAENGFGQVAAYRCMQTCIDKAKEYGIGAVGLRNSNNFGTAGYFGEMAANQSMIGIAMGNAAPAIAPPGGNKSILGTNPICFAFPSPKTDFHIVLDMATTNAARGKIRLALRNGEKIPMGWAVDAEGNPTDDPAEALKGSLIPMGGYKGFGLSMMIDIMAGLITGSAFGGDVKNLNHPDQFSRNGSLFIAVNTDFFMEREDYDSSIEQLIGKIRACGEEGKVTLPGEIEYNAYCENKEYVALKETQIQDTNELAASFDIDYELEVV